MTNKSFVEYAKSRDVFKLEFKLIKPKVELKIKSLRIARVSCYLIPKSYKSLNLSSKSMNLSSKSLNLGLKKLEFQA